MTWSAVGSWQGTADAALSLSNQAVGNLLILSAASADSTVYCSGLSGGGATWVPAGVAYAGVNSGGYFRIFFGRVTATGAQTVTPSWSGTTPANYGLVAHEFHSTVGSWALDKQGNLDNATGTANWVSLTPGHGAGELYFGYAFTNGSASVAGTTSGYVYQANADTFNQGAAYNVSCPGTATFPVWGASVEALGIMVLVAETPAIPRPQPVRAMIPPSPRARGVYMGVAPGDTSYGTGQIQWNAGAPVRNPTPGPVFRQATSPVRSRIPQNHARGVYMGVAPGDTSYGTGQIQWNAGAPVRNPTPGPVFRQATSPVRLVPPPPPRGRIGSSFTKQVQVPVHGPPVYPLQGPVKASLPLPRRGLCRAIRLYPLPVNPAPGPVFYQVTSPVQARRPLPIRGRVYRFTIPAVTPPSSGPVFVQANQAIRARRPLQPLLRGRSASNAGAPVRNPASGPVFRQATSPARGPVPGTFSKGRVSSNPGAPVRNPPAVFRPAVQAIRARLPLQPLLRGRSAFNIGAPVGNPVVGPVFHPAVQPIRSRIPQTFSKGRIRFNTGAPVKNPTVGPVFRLADSPIRAPIPQVFSKGRVSSNPGGPLRNPSPGPRTYALQGQARARLPQLAPRAGRTGSNPGAPVVHLGPVFSPATQALRARLPLQPLLRGRVASAPGAPVRNPSPGPRVYAPQGPVRARLPQLAPRAGRIAANPGSAPRNPTAGPVFTQRTSPAQARRPLPARGRVYSSALQKLTPPSSGPVFVQANQAIRARRPLQPLLRGRMASVWGAPVQNPTPGPSFTQATSPARIRASLPARGRVYSNPGQRLLVHIGPAFRPAVQALRARLPQQPFLRGRVTSNHGAPVHNPAPGPVFIQADSPARSRVPQTFSKGRVSSNSGAPVHNPTMGPAFRQVTSPARIRPALPPRGRIGSSRGAPVTVTVLGPVFSPRNLVKAQLPLPRRGTCRAIRFYPVPSNPAPGPVFTQATSPVRAHFPLPPRGRTGSNPGGPVQNSAPSVLFAQKTYPARIRPQLPPRGRIGFNPGAPVHNPVPGPVFRQAVRPAQPRIPQVFSKGRVSSSPGGPVLNPPAVLYPLLRPVRAQQPPPPRGRIGSNPGIPVFIPTTGPKVYPAKGPVQARRPLPRRGACRSIRFYPGVSNPTPGPVFRQAVKPIRVVIPQNAPRGRIWSNRGGPVENVPFATLRFRTGNPYFQWDTGVPWFQWQVSDPHLQWQTGIPEAG